MSYLGQETTTETIARKRFVKLTDEVIGIIKHSIITGFFRSQHRKAMADAAERN